MSTPGVGHNQPPGRWIAIDVGMLEHPVVGWKQPVTPADPKKKAASRCEAWLDLIRFARWKAGATDNQGTTVYVERGELMASLSFLASRWNWTVKQVRGFMQRLENEMMVTKTEPQPVPKPRPKVVTPVGKQDGRQKGKRRNNFTQHYRIENYDLYQSYRDMEDYLEGKQQDHPEEPPEGKRRASEGQESIQGDTKGTKEDTPPCSPPKGGSKKRAHQMPEGWKPKPQTWEWARGEKIGATNDQIQDQLEHFTDHARAKALRYADWDKAFQTWMRNAKAWGRLTVSQRRLAPWEVEAKEDAEKTKRALAELKAEKDQNNG